MRWLWVSAVVLLAPLSAQAEMPSEANIRGVAEAWLMKKPAPSFGAAMNMSEAAAVQERYNGLIAKDLGGVVGYKAGLTNPAVQKRFNYDRPIRGTLYEKMILPSDARVPAAYGARPVFEADMVAVVGDATKLMAARTPLEALQAIKEIRPFIELPDLVFDPQVKLDGPHLLGINVGARLGVLGEPISLSATTESVAKLGDMKVEIVDQTGAVLGGGKGSDVLGNPLNAVLWIAESLRSEGKALKNGELLSLGSFSALLPPKPGATITARYTGITPTPAEVKATFE
ncbi:MAG: fumarylacetoacetate hydrolase [candidate division NC10 bacterium]|nr:fumarylacetoacetate hydrolase [candidate division NC10 bacterium]MBI3085435.1 fumarylacetoacetate hydrolase [candidate division NC10 bacterium]